MSSPPPLRAHTWTRANGWLNFYSSEFDRDGGSELRGESARAGNKEQCGVEGGASGRVGEKLPGRVDATVRQM